MGTNLNSTFRVITQAERSILGSLFPMERRITTCSLSGRWSE